MDNANMWSAWVQYSRTRQDAIDVDAHWMHQHQRLLSNDINRILAAQARPAAQIRRLREDLRGLLAGVMARGLDQ